MDSMIRAYLRASTDEQDATRARETLRNFAKSYQRRIASFYIENVSGSSLQRPELIRLLNDSEKGDIILVESVDRLTRLKPDDWNSLCSMINEKGVFVVSLDLPTSYATFGNFPSDEIMNAVLKAINTMLLEILAAMAYKELLERARKQTEGIQRAKQVEGNYNGRPADEELHDNILQLSRNGMSIRKIAKALSTSESTVKRVRRDKKGLY